MAIFRLGKTGETGYNGTFTSVKSLRAACESAIAELTVPLSGEAPLLTYKGEAD